MCDDRLEMSQAGYGGLLVAYFLHGLYGLLISELRGCKINGIQMTSVLPSLFVIQTY
jgi:hypothetical protein